MATKSDWCKFAIFRGNPWRKFIEHLEICYKGTNIHESVVNKIPDFWLHKAQNVTACHMSYIEVVLRRTWTDAEELLKEKSFFILSFVFLSEFVISQVQTNIY